MSISIIIPVYNEELCVESCLRDTRRVFAHVDHEIIVVNDGSTDGSHEVITRLKDGNNRIKYVIYEENRGYSHAIRQGILLAEKEYTSYLDADLQYPPEELRRMYEYALRNQKMFVLGHPLQKYYRPTRRFISFVYNLLVNKLLKLDVSDANSLKLIKTGTLKQLDLKGNYGAIELEVLLGVVKRSIPIVLFPIRVQERIAGKSKANLRLVFSTFRSILGLRRA
ncbi:MAG: glycosyltransferase family 2 protein [Deltaproteobacteria bacterium]|nr:glycosyltransferase family 2 protein [Deltaproteobacteria bacterium]